MLELKEIQGIIISGYRSLPHSKFAFLQIKDPRRAKHWLQDILLEITTARTPPKPDFAVNIGFTYVGLRRLGLGRTAQAFSREFREGMANQARSRQLGDCGNSSPEKWLLGTRKGPRVHIVLLMYAKTAAHLSQLYEHLCPLQTREVFREVYVQDAFRPADDKEPFGFRDGMSQPAIEGSPIKPGPGQDVVRAGEFLLGYPDEYGYVPPSPTVPAGYDPNSILPDSSHAGLKDFGKNGSYLVWRKLQQDVESFNTYVEKTADSINREVDDPEITAEWVAAKLMGRWRSGAPLVLSPNFDDAALGSDECRNNDFNYATADPYGYACPIASHVRRANPRDGLTPYVKGSHRLANRHRIIRRGRRYKDEYREAEEGVVFMAINADIGRQFEFVQQSWINNSQFNGLYDDKDPISADNDTKGAGSMTIPYEPARLRLHGLQRFVTVKGGGYFFLPSTKALKFLASPFPRIQEIPTRERVVRQRPATLVLVRELSFPLVAIAHKLSVRYEHLKLRCAKKFEGGLAKPGLTRRIFGLLRRRRPILLWRPFRFAVVSKYDDVVEVLHNDPVFVPPYLRKIEETTGTFAVGLHVDDPRYKEQISLMRSVVDDRDPDRIRTRVAQIAEQLISSACPRGRIDAVGGLSRVVGARFVADYFGVPGPEEETLIRWMHDLFRHIFMNLLNLKVVQTRAIGSAHELTKYLNDLVAERKLQISLGKAKDNFLNRLLTRYGNTVPDELIVRIIGGTIVGTVGLSKAFAQGLDQLLDRPVELRKAHRAAILDLTPKVSNYIFEALRFNPQNPVLLRCCERDFVLANGTGRKHIIPAGTTVFVGPMSAMFDDSVLPTPNEFRAGRPGHHYVHFGYGPHECFGKQMALAVIPEIAKALLCRKGLRRAAGRDGKLVYDGALPDRLILEFDSD